MPRPQLFAISIPVSDPNDPRYIVPVGQQYTGVVLLELADDEVCTGALLPSGHHILSAAHCFEHHEEGSDRFTQNPNPDNVWVVFQLPDADLEMEVDRIIMHPGWRNDADSNNDLAILELTAPAPEEAERYELYRGQDEVGQVFTRVGFGTRATGSAGEDDTEEESVMRVGQNRYEALGEIFNRAGDAVLPGTQLVYDFDSGRSQNDALGQAFGKTDLGLGLQEIGSSAGDSGGPALIEGKIAGISSSGMSPKQAGIDVTAENDTSFGEFFFDTRVSAFADYIDQTVAQLATGDAPVAEKIEQTEGPIPPLPSTPPTNLAWLLILPASLAVGVSIAWLRRH